MILSFHPCFLGDTLVILGDGTIDAHDLRHINKAEIILLPQYCTLELYRACKDSSALLFPNYDMRFRYPGKIGQSLLFKKLKHAHPQTRQWPSVEVFKKGYHESGFPHPVPFLIKADEAHEAENIYQISDEATLNASMADLQRMESRGSSGFVSQELIATEGNVLRVAIIGKRTITYWKRAQRPGQTITTISRGAEVDREWRTDLQDRGEKEAKKLVAATGINLAAIDFIFDFSQPDPEPLFLEINYVFGRRGLGGSMNFYRLLSEALQEWLKEHGFDPELITPL